MDNETKQLGEIKSSKGRNLLYESFIGPAEQAETSIVKDETTIQESAWHPDSLENPYNPDKIYKKTGDYSIYEDMIDDDQVSVCLQLKKDLILSSGWNIESEGTDEQSTQIKNEIEQLLREHCEGSIEDQLDELCHSKHGFGFAISEKLFKKLPDGRIAFKKFKTRHPSTWRIKTDEKGNVIEYLQHGLRQDLIIDPSTIIHLINNSRFGNPYGTSDLKPAYAAWFAKRQIIRFYAIYLEKAASPIPIARYDQNAPKGAVDDIQRAIKNFQTKTAMTIPKEIEVEFLESKTNGEAYVKGINIFNMFIGRSLLIPDLLGFQGSETSGGSYSLGRDQMNVFFKHINRHRKSIEHMFNENVIKPMVIANYGFVENFPKFKLKPIEEEDALNMAKTWLEAVKGKVYKPSQEEINYFRSLVNFPEGDVEFVESQPNPTMGFKKEIDDKKDFANKAYNNPEGNFYKRVDFKALETTMNSTRNKIIAESKPVVKKIIDDLKDQIEKKKIIQNVKPDRMDSLKLKYLKELQLIFKSAFKDLFVEAQNQAQDEIFKGKYKTVLPTDEFLNVFENETYKYIGDWEYNITKKTKEALIAALKDGTPLSTVLAEIDEITSEYSQVSIDRYARTKTTEMMNRARHDYFENSGVIQGYQYSAILDDRTTEICSGLHGKFFKSGTEPIPPLHFNALCQGSNITTKDGDRKIENIQIGDLVLTHKNQFQKVYEVMNKFEDKDYFEIILEDGKKLKATGEHPILTNRGWIRSDELLMTDNIICIEDITNVK